MTNEIRWDPAYLLAGPAKDGVFTWAVRCEACGYEGNNLPTKEQAKAALNEHRQNCPGG